MVGESALSTRRSEAEETKATVGGLYGTSDKSSRRPKKYLFLQFSHHHPRVGTGPERNSRRKALALCAALLLPVDSRALQPGGDFCLLPCLDHNNPPLLLSKEIDLAASGLASRAGTSAEISLGETWILYIAKARTLTKAEVQFRSSNSFNSSRARQGTLRT